MSIWSTKETTRRCGFAFVVLLGSAVSLGADALAGDAEQGAVIYAERCARCHGVSINMVVSPEDAPRLATFLASHKIRFDPIRRDQDNADLAAYLVSLSPLQRN
ncbi:hypothetical protein [Celeribacter sp.]|uniref:hypothetical protein n=1 Tax=Celeribacter sp. TaxID=1890673 RepID=UPI003A94A19E